VLIDATAHALLIVRRAASIPRSSLRSLTSGGSANT
jgi:hypothetical protein